LVGVEKERRPVLKNIEKPEQGHKVVGVKDA
jgi:hypothetical protein